MGLGHLDTVISFAAIMLLLSLQVTILVQVIVAITGLRGWNLQWGLRRLFEQVDPQLNLKEMANRLASTVLQHPAVAPMRGVWVKRKATAIRLSELLQILDELSTNSGKENEDMARRLKGALEKDLPGSTMDFASRAALIEKELIRSFPDKAAEVKDAVSRALEKKRQLQNELETWFDSVMDRTTERFTLHTRWITAAFAFLIVAALQVDSIYIFQQLDASGSLRARLLASAESTLTEAEKVLGDTKAPAALATEALRVLQQDRRNSPGGGQLVNVEVPDNLVSRADGEVWISRTFPDSEIQRQLVTEYGSSFDRVTLERLRKLGISFEGVKDSIERAGLQLIYPDGPDRSNPRYGKPLHGLGVIVSGIFLSLGAPFWYNALRQLVNLRPLIAQKVDKESSAR